MAYRKIGLWVGLVVVLVSIIAVLAWDWWPGAPHSREKNVTVYLPPKSETLGVSAYLQPPLATLTTGLLPVVSIQFTSHEHTAAKVWDPCESGETSGVTQPWLALTLLKDQEASPFHRFRSSNATLDARPIDKAGVGVNPVFDGTQPDCASWRRGFASHERRTHLYPCT